MEIIQPHNLEQQIFVVPRVFHSEYVYIRINNENTGDKSEVLADVSVSGDYLAVTHIFDLKEGETASYLIYKLDSEYISRVTTDSGIIEAHTCLTDEELSVVGKEVMYRGKLYATYQSADLNYQISKGDYIEEQSHNNDYLTF